MTKIESIAADISWWLALYDTDEVDLLGARNLLERIRTELLSIPTPNIESGSSLGKNKNSLLSQHSQ